MRTEIRLSPKAVQTINEILSSGKKCNISVIGQRLRITEVSDGKVKYDTMIPKE